VLLCWKWSKQQVVEEDQIYNNAGIEVKPEFPGGMDKFYGYVGKNIVRRRRGFEGSYVTFVVEKMVH
jgi:protein TonB